MTCRCGVVEGLYPSDHGISYKLAQFICDHLNGMDARGEHDASQKYAWANTLEVGKEYAHCWIKYQ